MIRKLLHTVNSVAKIRVKQMAQNHPWLRILNSRCMAPRKTLLQTDRRSRILILQDPTTGKASPCCGRIYYSGKINSPVAKGTLNNKTGKIKHIITYSYNYVHIITFTPYRFPLQVVIITSILPSESEKYLDTPWNKII